MREFLCKRKKTLYSARLQTIDAKDESFRDLPVGLKLKKKKFKQRKCGKIMQPILLFERHKKKFCNGNL